MGRPDHSTKVQILNLKKYQILKKTRIILLGIAVLAVVGAALAFKAAKNLPYTFYGCGTTITMIGGPAVTGCFWPTTLQYCITSFGANTIIPYNSTTIVTACTLNTNPNDWNTCGTSRVTVCLSE